MRMKHEFVEYIPDELNEGVIYISIPFSTAIHKCVCGCGNEVVTPFSPTDWKLIFNGETVSLTPSIGNWTLPCQSHYWIREDKVIWAEKWSPSRIEANIKREDFERKQYYKKKKGLRSLLEWWRK